MSTYPEVRVSGHCYGGCLSYEVHLPEGERPIFTAYCHCDSCRRSHAAPLYQVVCVAEEQFRITAGAEHLVEYTKPGGTITRAFCGACGTRILNRFGDWRVRGHTPLVFFPNTLDEGTMDDLPPTLRPRKNSFPDGCVLDPERLREVLDR